MKGCQLSYLENLADSDPQVRARLENLSNSNRSLGRELDVDEKNVRRWRARHMADPQSVSSPQPKYKNGVAQWVPGMDLGETDGEVRTLPRVVGDGIDEPEDAELMNELGVDPEKWEIIARRESRWQQFDDGPFLRAYRISVRRRSSRTGSLSVESMNEILRQDYSGRVPVLEGNSSLDWDNRIFVVPVGDLQVGKIEGGGTPALIDRFAEMTEQAKRRLQIAGGTKRLVLPWLGDCIEGIVSQGGRLATRLDISVTEQVRVYRRLMLHQIATLAPLAEHVVIAVVPGNHDETTRQFATSPTDSWAIEGASAVQDALTLAEKYRHVSFVYPTTEHLTIALEVGTATRPFSLGFSHGHQPGTPTRSLQWWKDQGFGRQAVGQTDMLFTGHFHHLRIEATGGGRTWVQIPQLDGGSGWFREKKGEDEAAGMISLWVTPGQNNGWEGLTVHQ
jgi:hypothetical protein